jgi:aminoglycoside phosphotransferase family enzyme/predicted kinase
MIDSHGSGAATVAETHISVLVMVGERAYKLKKPVRLDFIDLSTREARERICHREVELNRRIAPDVYLGVADVLGPDQTVCDHLVVMRRMPEDRRLSTLVCAGTVVEGQVRQVARSIAAFHAGAATSDLIAASGRAEAQQARWDQTFATMDRFPDSIVPREIEGRIRVLAREYLAGRTRLFGDRIARGKIRDGHGDLLADDIFCLDDGPRILDCVEFDDQLRYGDVLADVCFLAMDLERLGARELGRRFLGWYREFSAETYPATLAEHYLGYRAHIRAMVACVRADQQAGGTQTVEEARRLLDIAHAHLERGQVPIVLVGGLPGTGKSTLAAGLADRLDWAVLRSDEVRKNLAGMNPADHAGAPMGQGIYTAGMTDSTYNELLRHATRLVEFGEPVILDASWTDRRHRDLALAAAQRTSSRLIELECRAPADVAEIRLRSRARAGRDASDATPAVARSMAGRADPWPSAHPVDTRAAPDRVVEQAATMVDSILSACGCRKPHPSRPLGLSSGALG